MPSEITMPQLSDTMTEGTIIKWYKKEGEKVKAGEKVADVETDKAVMEMEAFESGTMAAILVSAGKKVSVGAAMALIAVGQEDPAEVKRSAGSPAARRVPVGAVHGPTFEKAITSEVHEPDSVAGHSATRQPMTAYPPLPQRQDGDDRIPISPLARRIATENKIDLHALRGSGPGGRITKEDVLARLGNAQAAAPAKPSAAPAAAPAPASAPASFAPLPPGERKVIALSPMRSAIAKQLVYSKQSIPHFYETIDVEVDQLAQMRARLNTILEPEKIRLSLADFLVKALTTALQSHPALNATFNGTEVSQYADVHLGIAVAVPDGLIVPVLRNANQLSLRDIRQKSADLFERARAARLKQDEMTGGTFTVTNLGTFGIRDFAAIINPPQVAILAIGVAEPRAVVRDGQVVARTMMSLTLSADHRVVDGATAADFLKTLKGLIQEPGMILVFK